MKYEEMKYDIEKFFDYSLDMLCIARLDGYIFRINPSFQKAFGWKSEDLLAFGSYTFLHPDDVEPTYQVVEKLKKRYTYRIFSKSLSLYQWRIQKLFLDGFSRSTF
ncbi:PAS domain S-box protein [Leptospira interrogans serovar Canicola]|nr:PAS domain S-box protein [Leptospira interrogans serovar Canicola]